MRMRHRCTKAKTNSTTAVPAPFPALTSFLQQLGKRLMRPKVFFFLRGCCIYWLLYRSLDCEFTWQLGVFLERSSARHSSCRRNRRCSFLLLFCVILRSVYTLAFISIFSLFLNDICWGASFGQFVTADVMCFLFTLWVCVCVRQAGWVTWLMDCVGVQQPDDAYQSKLAYWETQPVVMLFHRTSEWGHCCWVGTQALRHVRCRGITRGTIWQALNNKAGIIVTKTHESGRLCRLCYDVCALGGQCSYMWQHKLWNTAVEFNVLPVRTRDVCRITHISPKPRWRRTDIAWV